MLLSCCESLSECVERHDRCPPSRHETEFPCSPVSATKCVCTVFTHSHAQTLETVCPGAKDRYVPRCVTCSQDIQILHPQPCLAVRASDCLHTTFCGAVFETLTVTLSLSLSDSSQMSRSIAGCWPKRKRTTSTFLDNMDVPRAALGVSDVLGTATTPPGPHELA